MTDGSGDARVRLVKDLFDRVLDAPAAERGAILDREAGDRRIRDEVEALLATESRLSGFLEVPAAHRIFGAPEVVARLAPGDVVADFRVVGVLGEGGGGIVYEAEQREPRRRVALKMTRVRGRSGDAQRRFREEAAHLARLQHAAIAHVYAAGVCERDGRTCPWIAMERVDGARGVVRHAAEEGLDRGARLRLLLVACDAIHHAHENGVIHRDLTPGNVLVDRHGNPKIVDFGFAVGGADAARSASSVGGTLAYASPEQLSGGGDGADRRTDVYGLGALLYELLTGSVPHDVDDLPVAEAARTKLERPVVALRVRAKGTPADLDAIVLRALAPRPEGRYETVASLADDLRRFLGNEPVAAYGGGTWYHLRKFARRRRAVAASIVGIGAALVAGTAVSLRLAVESAAARDLAERRSYLAEIAAAAAALRVDDIAEAGRRLDRAPPILRDWEWRHLASRLDGSAGTVPFGSRELWTGSVSADGRFVAVAGLDRSVPSGRRFAALARGDGVLLREWTDTGANVPVAAVSADGRRLAAGFSDGRVTICDVATLRELPPPAPHAGRVIAATFSPDGALLATAGADGSAHVRSAADGAVLATFAGHPDWVICAAFDPAGRRLVTGCRDGSIRVWDLARGATDLVLTGHEGSVDGVAVGPDGATMASVGRDQSVRLWNLADGTSVAVGRSHSSNVRDVAFDPRGRSFVSASWDGTLRVWDAKTGAETGLLRGHGSAVTKVAFTGAAPRLASFSLDGTMKRWDVERTDVASARGPRDSTAALDFDPEGARVAVAGTDGSLSILDARTARVTARAETGGAPLGNVRFLDASSLVAVGRAGELEVWSVAADTGGLSRVRRFAPEGACSDQVAVDRSAAAAWIFRQRHGWELACVDLVSGEVRTSLPIPFGPGAVSCDARGRLAAGSRDGHVAVRDRGGTWRTVSVGPHAIRSVAFDASGERVVAAGEQGTAVVVRASDLEVLHVLRGHAGDVYRAEFLPGGRRIATASRDHTVRLWDAGDGENVLVLREHGYPVTCLAVSPDGVRIATAAASGGELQSSITIWSAPPAPR